VISIASSWNELSAVLSGMSLAVTGVTVSNTAGSWSTVELSLIATDRDSTPTAMDITSSIQGRGWTSCDALLPDSDDTVLVSRDGEVSTANYWGDAWSLSPEPTHWMPMPTPPHAVKTKKQKAKR
jgi:hypothetical protein